jgi:hypothetical protein
VEDSGGGRSGDLRLPIAVAGLLLLATLVGVMLLGRGSSGKTAAAAPPRCVSLWNEDRQALTYGYHSFHGHRYTEAEVLYLDQGGHPARQGDCAVVFPSATLDPEPFVAIKIHRSGRWQSLSGMRGVSEVRLAELQVEAVEGANVVLGPGGALEDR